MFVFRVCVFVGLFSAGLLFGQQTVRSADAVCARCHGEVYRRYLLTPMANASGAAGDRLMPGGFTQAGAGVHYEVGRAPDGAYLSFADGRDGRIAGKHRLDYYLGSGHLGVTYLYTQEGYLLESPVAWYAATGGYDMKPGLGQLKEMPGAIPMEATCLRCHMSGVAATEPGTLNRYAGLPFGQTGITCEGCHGEAGAHVRTGGKAAVVNPAKLDADRRDSVCISCHLEGDVTVQRAGRSPLAYRPGDRISDYLSYFIFASNNPLDRGVSEVEQFGASRCKRASGDGMSCTSCHDPHGSPAAAERVAFYRGRCLACHGASFGASHHVENSDCTSCHMPRSTAENIPHVAWTDHRILREPGAGLPSRGAEKQSSLTAIYSPQANDRDAAMARYTSLMVGLSQDREGTLVKLEGAYVAGSRDVRLLEALGVTEALSGRGRESEARFRELLRVDPVNLTALSNLGVYVARRGDVAAAVALWKPAFARNEDMMDFAHNLALAECAMGDEAGAKATFAEALKFSPGARAAWGFRCGGAGSSEGAGAARQ